MVLDRVKVEKSWSLTFNEMVRPDRCALDSLWATCLACLSSRDPKMAGSVWSVS